MNSSIIFYFAAIILSVSMLSCGGNRRFNRDKALFESSAVIGKYKSVADMNDAFFVIKENNFFEFYRQLFDSVKNTSYPGKFTRKGDTLLLEFYNNKGANILGRKALINSAKKEIIFFDRHPGPKKKQVIN